MTGSYKWYDILEDIVTNYNHSRHRTIKITPFDAYKSKNRVQIFKNQEKRIANKKKEKPKFKRGDHVRLSIQKQVFDKGFRPNWTEEIFRVKGVHRKYMPIMYSIKDMNDDEIEGKFYRYELQKVPEPKEFAIEKILQKKNDEFKVKFLGYKQ